MHNRDLQSPTFQDIVQSDSEAGNQVPTLRALDVWAAGDVSVVDITGKTRTRTITAAMLPFRWVVQIKRVGAALTTVADGDLDGLS